MTESPGPSHASEKAPLPFDLFIAVTAIITLTLLSCRYFMDKSTETVKLIDYFDHGICAIFFFDFCRNFFYASSKWRYFVTWGWVDLLASIPLVHALRFARLARIIILIRAVKSMHAIMISIRENRRSSLVVTGFFIAEIILIGASLSVLHFESQDPLANIKTADDVLWWSVVTISTVGYGDYYPVTAGGRFMASLLMFAGIGIFAMFAGVFADALRSATINIEAKASQIPKKSKSDNN